MNALNSPFPDSEDFAEGNSPVRDLTLVEQLEYWKQRAQLAEQIIWKQADLLDLEAEMEAAEASDTADRWKGV